MKCIYTLFLIAFLTSFYVKAQKIESISFAFTSETFSFPFTRLGPLHPGLEIGATIWNKEKKKSIREINIFLGGYHHRKVENGIYLRADYMHTFKLNKSIGIDLPIGAGYLHTFYPGTLYRQNTETGNFSEVRQSGRSAALVNIGFGFTYINIKKIQPFIRYESMIDFPLYNGLTAIKTFLKIGINYKFN